MTKTYGGNSIFKYSWYDIAVAFWRKYPNKYSKHVLSEDIIDRKINEGQQLVTRRLFLKTNSCPKWIERLMRSKNVHILEESIVDPIQRTLTTITRNIGMTNLISVIETTVYRPHPDNNNNWTLVERKASFESKLSGLRRLAVLTFAYERYKYNIRRADKGFQQVISK